MASTDGQGPDTGGVDCPMLEHCRQEIHRRRLAFTTLAVAVEPPEPHQHSPWGLAMTPRYPFRCADGQC